MYILHQSGTVFCFVKFYHIYVQNLKKKNALLHWFNVNTLYEGIGMK